MKSSTFETLLGIKIDNKLRLNAQVAHLCKKSSRKIQSLARINPYMTVSERHILMNAFFRSQFSYYPLVWMCHRRILDNKINRLLERCLRITYKDNRSSSHRRYLQIFSAHILVQITIYVISMSLLGRW